MAARKTRIGTHERNIGVTTTKWQTAFLFGAIVMGIASVVFSVTGAIWGEMSAGDKLVWGLVLGLSGIAILAGLRVCGERPTLGGGLIVAGALAMGITMYWSIVVPVAAVLLAIYGIHRATSSAREQQA